MKFKESKSIYLQIADRICDEILQGQYTEEERILSVREYAATVEVNANTVVRTYDYPETRCTSLIIIKSLNTILQRKRILQLCVRIWMTEKMRLVLVRYA